MQEITVKDLDENMTVVSDWANAHNKCIVDGDFYNRMMVDSLKLSKREVPQMVNTSDDFVYGDDRFRCPGCSTDVDRGCNYCRNCGARLKFPSR